MLPTWFMKPGQLVPNWKDMVMPLTTPMAKVSANTLVQTLNAVSQALSAVLAKRMRKYTSSQARPMVSVGNRIWKAILSPNWARASSSASPPSMGGYSAPVCKGLGGPCDLPAQFPTTGDRCHEKDARRARRPGLRHARLRAGQDGQEGRHEEGRNEEGCNEEGRHDEKGRDEEG